VSLTGAATSTVVGITGALTLSGTLAASTQTGASGQVDLGGIANWALINSFIGGTFTLTGAVSAASPASAAGSLDLVADYFVAAANPASISGAFTLSGAVASSASPSSTGSITLNGSLMAAALAVMSGSLSLTGTADTMLEGGAAGSFTLNGVVQAAVQAAVSGSVSLAGTGAASSGDIAATANGALTLGGAAASQASLGTALGQLVLSGVLGAYSPSTALGQLELGAYPVLTRALLANIVGTLSLGGSAAASQDGLIRMGSLQLGAPRLLLLNASANPLAAGLPSLSLATSGASQLTLERVQVKTLRRSARRAAMGIRARSAVMLTNSSATAVLTDNAEG
jgi:hypothetical protein